MRNNTDKRQLLTMLRSSDIEIVQLAENMVYKNFKMNFRIYYNRFSEEFTLDPQNDVYWSYKSASMLLYRALRNYYDLTHNLDKIIDLIFEYNEIYN